MFVVCKSKKVIIVGAIFTEAYQAGFAKSEEIYLAGDINGEAMIEDTFLMGLQVQHKYLISPHE